MFFSYEVGFAHAGWNGETHVRAFKTKRERDEHVRFVQQEAEADRVYRERGGRDVWPGKYTRFDWSFPVSAKAARIIARSHKSLYESGRVPFYYELVA